MDITTLGIDVSKNSFHVIGTDRAGKPLFRQKFPLRSSPSSLPIIRRASLAWKHVLAHNTLPAGSRSSTTK